MKTRAKKIIEKYSKDLARDIVNYGKEDHTSLICKNCKVIISNPNFEENFTGTCLDCIREKE
jgi:hypothetical protein